MPKKVRYNPELHNAPILRIGASNYVAFEYRYDQQREGRNNWYSRMLLLTSPGHVVVAPSDKIKSDAAQGK